MTCSSDCSKVLDQQPAANKRSKRQASLVCRDGQVFCVGSQACSEACEAEDDVEGTKCPEGQTFCPDSQTCSETCDKGHQGLGRITKRETETACSDDQVFCINTQTCSESCDDQDQPGEANDGTECPQGLTFCVDRQSCAESCHTDENLGLNRVAKRDIQGACLDGEVYCVGTQTCSRSCSDDDDDGSVASPIEASVDCPDGQNLCLETGRCGIDCWGIRTKDSLTIWTSEIRCPYGQVVCLDSGTCAQDCGAGSFDGTGNRDDVISDCPEGTTFCLLTNACSADCSGDADNDGADLAQFQTCPQGTIFCIGTGLCQEGTNEKTLIGDNYFGKLAINCFSQVIILIVLKEYYINLSTTRDYYYPKAWKQNFLEPRVK